MLILSRDDIKKCITMKDTIEICKNALKNYSLGLANVPLRNKLDVKDSNGQILFMPANINDADNALGIKIVSVYPNNIKLNLPSVPATMLIFDPKTGIASGLIDGTYLTKLRTAALQGAATDLLAKENSKIATLIGTGGQAYEQAHAMLCVRNLEELRVVGRNFEKTKKFVQLLKNDFNNFKTKFVEFEDANKAVIDSDIITTVTTSKVPTFNAKFVKRGAHINGIGSFTPEMIELPKEIINKKNKIYFDTNEGVLSEAGDIILPLKENLIGINDFIGELGELILNPEIGRKDNDEITVFKSVGTAVLDIACGNEIVKHALKLNIGKKVNL
ncbi:ornithine cyclodeaminase [Gemella cuniculi]|uniref:ornithine cyclodeaminase n=1 Tax=Gemella cuniculi TaxID=150240 RepID=UPI0004219D15|nr:ornithine cyclodeaminase [Gemella cuniculi]